MKIAVITDDQQTISQHFGRARYYYVATVEDGKVIAFETRAKANHSHFAGEHADEHVHPRDGNHGQGHGEDAASAQRHATMMDAIADCQVILVRGMGMGAFNALKERGIQPIVTDIGEIESALKAYLAGEIVDHPEKLH
jgi:predicted Fe-Mo cluster-binding NifX family protein